FAPITRKDDVNLNGHQTTVSTEKENFSSHRLASYSKYPGFGHGNSGRHPSSFRKGNTSSGQSPDFCKNQNLL
ncbi:hypothetical protein, partial [Acetobacter pasteurianus]|uniref:hypothetical protein n=2 Tax=Acetobacter pasteurianus TaxID=438 RepID=UPI001E5409F0